MRAKSSWITISSMHDTPRNLPAPNQIGVLAATVLLCYALTHLASRPGLTLAIQLPGFYFAYSLTLGTAMTTHGRRPDGERHGLAAARASRPAGKADRAALDASYTDGPHHRHCPGYPVRMGLHGGPVWPSAQSSWSQCSSQSTSRWTLGSPFYALASAGLTALSYSMFLLFIISLRLGAARLFLVVPAVFIASGLVSLRTLHLRLGELWDYPWAFGIGLVCSQVAAGVHYWPLSSLQFGLAVLAPLYTLTALASGLQRHSHGEAPWQNRA